MILQFFVKFIGKSKYLQKILFKKIKSHFKNKFVRIKSLLVKTMS